MNLLAWILAFSVLGSVLSLAAAALYLLLPKRMRDRSLDYLVSFATGMLLGAGFLHLLPEALELASDQTKGLMATVLIAILTFFLLEKGLIWRHHHHTADLHEGGAHSHAGERPAGGSTAAPGRRSRSIGIGRDERGDRPGRKRARCRTLESRRLV